MKRTLLALVAVLLWHGTAHAGLEEYPELVVADGKTTQSGAVRITYLGTNGYQIEAAGSALLVDPYFSRAGLGAAIFNGAIFPDPKLVATMLARLHAKPAAVLVTHAHYDHLLDVPLAMKATGAELVSGATAVNLVRAQGVRESQCRAVAPGERLRIGPWKIRAVQASHDRVLCRVPFPGERDHVPPAPLMAGDWVLGEPLAFVIEVAGRRIYIDSGGRPGRALPRDIGPVDLAILGVALPDSRRRYADAVATLRPRYVLPSHQDDFFRPLDRGFVFGPMTDFTYVLDVHARRKLPGEIVLLDYFAPWTLP